MSLLVTGLFLAFFVAQLLVETRLDLLNLAHGAKAHQPLHPALAQKVEPEKLAKTQAYTRARIKLGLAERGWLATLTLVMLLAGGLPWLERLVGRGLVGAYERLFGLGGPGLAGYHYPVAFLAALGLIFALAGWPFSLLRVFAVEHRFGFNRQTLGGWAADRLKGLALALLLGVPFLYGVVWFMEQTGRGWWLWLAGFITAFQLFLVWLHPTLIAPFFNKFTPLEEGELKSRVEALARQGGFEPKGVFVMDASRRSGHSNAYFTGFGRAKRIVLFDTLLSQLTPAQTEAVLAHEIGHYRLGHITKRLALSLGLTAGLLFALNLVYEWEPLYRAFGLAGPTPYGALALLTLLSGSFTFWLAPLLARYSRRHEYQADRWALNDVSRADPLRQALITLGVENLSNLNPHPAYSAYHYSHPALNERLHAIDQIEAQLKNG